MKKANHLLAVLCGIGLMTACNSGAQHLTAIDFANVQEYIAANDENFKVDSINGYSTFSADNHIVIVPEEITQKEYERLLTDKYTLQPVSIDTNSPLYAELYKKGMENTVRYEKVRGLWWEEEDNLQEEERDYYIIPIYHYSETKQYEYVMLAPLTNESFMMTEDGIIDSTFMQSETRTYGTNRIFVGQEGHDCDYHGSLWFYRYDEQTHHMIPLCHYKDYRWFEDCYDFNFCWISNNELLLKAASTGNNSEWGWVGGYRPTNLAPHGTPVYYKLTLTIR
jgi:hypothetical protein